MDKITKQCPRCGKFFTVPARFSKQIYCSHSCGSFGKPKSKGFRSTTDVTTVTCQMCGKQFVVRTKYTKRFRAKFCSKSCHNKSMQRRITLTCQACGKEFEVRAKFRKRKYCSRTCRTVGLGRTKTKIEIAMEASLKDAGINAVPQFPIFRYSLDFAIPESKIAIECDGDYWHSLPECKRRDKSKDSYLANRGWLVLRFSESQINADISLCIQQIRQALSQRTACPLPSQ